MAEKEIYMLGVRTVLDELNKRNTQAGTYLDGLIAGIQIGLNIDARYGNQHKSQPGDDNDNSLGEIAISEEYDKYNIEKGTKNVPRFHRRHRSYDDANKKQIVQEFYESGFDMKAVRNKWCVLGKGTIKRWVELFSEELGLDIKTYKDYLKSKKQK